MPYSQNGTTPPSHKAATKCSGGPKAPFGKILREEDLTGPSQSTRIWIDDVNLDGKLDILVGDNVTLASAGEGIDPKEFEKKFSDWNKSYQATMASYQKISQEHLAAKKELAGKKGDEAKKAKEKLAEITKQYTEEQKKLTRCYEAQGKIVKNEQTGFVWLYLQK